MFIAMKLKMSTNIINALSIITLMTVELHCMLDVEVLLCLSYDVSNIWFLLGFTKGDL